METVSVLLPNTFFLSCVCVAVSHVHVNVEPELCLETTTYSWPQKQPLDKNTSQHKVHLCFKVRLWSFKHVFRPPDTMESICNRLLGLVLRIDGQFVSLFVPSDIKYFSPWCDDPMIFCLFPKSLIVEDWTSFNAGNEFNNYTFFPKEKKKGVLTCCWNEYFTHCLVIIKYFWFRLLVRSQFFF